MFRVIRGQGRGRTADLPLFSSSVGLLWGTTPDLWGFCGAAAALRLPADAPSKNLEPMGRDDPAPLSAREEIGSDPDRLIHG